MRIMLMLLVLAGLLSACERKDQMPKPTVAGDSHVVPDAAGRR
ncbi:hypothetical protein [Herbaspirillum autotrophicum]|nr:hypothetical protein [Herbaspirillum autotrophicum]